MAQMGSGISRSEESSLYDVLRSIELIKEYVGESSFEEFAGDQGIQDSVIYRLGVIGEAVNNLRKDNSSILEEHSEIPWNSIVGLRNRLFHKYWDTHLEIIWDAISLLTTLAEAVEDFLNNST